MLCPGACADPDCGFCFQIGQVCYQFAKMVMVGALKLVFDYNSIPILILGNQIDLKVSRQ
jgi:hypothetical protein